MNVKGARLAHVGVAVKSVEEAAKFWRDALGLEDPAQCAFVLPEHRLKVLFLDAGGGVQLELLEGMGDDTITPFIAKRGEGIHHISFRVDSLEDAVADLKSRGYEFVTEIRGGAHGARVVFMHPRSANGVLIELTSHS